MAITTTTQTRTFLHSYTFDNISRAEWSGHVNRNKTDWHSYFSTGLDQVRWKLVFRTDFEKLSLDCRRQIKPGQFYTAIHLTI